jgi:hypothetical protein
MDIGDFVKTLYFVVGYGQVGFRASSCLHSLPVDTDAGMGACFQNAS